MSELTLRHATPADRDALITLWTRCGLIRPWNDPASDIALALNHSSASILIGESEDTLAASAMLGFDGHRGWVYYVSVDPEFRGRGFSRLIMTAAEDWLRAAGCPKLEVIIRAENIGVQLVYERLGYTREPRALMTKWLIEPPARQDREPAAPLIPVTITWLEMTVPPRHRARPAPALPGKPLLLQRISKPSVGFYRYIQHNVGDPWLWFSRREMTDAELGAIIQDDRVEFHVLSAGGEPAGFVELDFREMPASAEIAYFGLMPHFIGAGLGPYLLDWAIHYCWSKDPAPTRLLVNTCTLDHPAALGGYQKAGFSPYDRADTHFPDPVEAGIIPRTVDILSPGYEKP